MKRREFLRKSMLATLGAAVAGSGVADAFNVIKNKKMKIVVLTGSPRKNGNSAYLAEQFIKGAPKKAAFLMTYADTAAKEAEPMLVHYRTLMEYLGWTSVGEVVAAGVWTAGSVRNTNYPQQAYKLGKSL